MTSNWIGLDRGDETLSAVERLPTDVVPELLAAASVVCTHLVTEPFGHYAASLEVPSGLAADEAAALVERCARSGVAVSVDGAELVFGGAPDLVSGALLAAASHHDRSGGRAIRYPGQERLRGVLSVADVVASTAVERVEALGATAWPESRVETRDFVRPFFRDGELVLFATARADGSLQPFEAEKPHECCDGGHRAPVAPQLTARPGTPSP